MQIEIADKQDILIDKSNQLERSEKAYRVKCEEIDRLILDNKEHLIKREASNR